MMAGVPVLIGSCIFLTRVTWNEVRDFKPNCEVRKEGRRSWF